MTDEDKILLEMAAKAAKLKNYRYRPAEDGLRECIEYDDEGLLDKEDDVVKGLDAAVRRAIVRAAAEIGKAMQ